MPGILNYTTQIDPEKTAAEIQRILGKGKALAVSMQFSASGRVTGLSFSARTSYGVRDFALPITEEVVTAVFNSMRRDQVPRRYQTREQAERVAWRIMKDWMESLMALVSLNMVPLDQAMLAYMVTDGGSTLYARFVERQLAELEAGHGQL